MGWFWIGYKRSMGILRFISVNVWTERANQESPIP